MPRLTAEQWEEAQADYEVKGLSTHDIAKKYGVSQAAVAKMSKKLSWEKDKGCQTAAKKVQAVKDYAEAENEKLSKPITCQEAIEDLFEEQLCQEGILASLSNAIARKARGMVMTAETLDDIEKLSRVKKNLTPPAAAQNTITVQQAAMSRADAAADLTPEQVCDELIAAQEEEKKRGRKESPYFMRPENRTKNASDR